MTYLFSALALYLLLKFYLPEVSSIKHNDLLFNKSISNVSCTIFPALLMKNCIVRSILDIFFFIIVNWTQPRVTWHELQLINGLDQVSL